MFYTTKNIISDYLIEESERAVLLFGGDSRFKKEMATGGWHLAV